MVKLCSKSGQNPDKLIKKLKMFINLNLGLYNKSILKPIKTKSALQGKFLARIFA